MPTHTPPVALTEGPLHDLARSMTPRIPEILKEHGLEWLPNDTGSIVTAPGQVNFYEWYWAYGALLMPKRVLEIGVFGGASMTFLCLGAASAGMSPEFIELIDNETYPYPLAKAAERIQKVAPSADILQVMSDSQWMRKLWAPKGGNFDLISVDGDHRLGPAYHDIRIVAPHLAEDGHILCDDANYDGVVDAVDDYRAEHPELAAHLVETLTNTLVLHRADNGHLERCPLLRKSSAGVVESAP